MRIECKKYNDTTPLSDRELRGEIDHALAGDPALEAWVLVATREVSEKIHAELNDSELRRAMQKPEEHLGEQFLGQKIVDGVGPWYNKPEAGMNATELKGEGAL